MTTNTPVTTAAIQLSIRMIGIRDKVTALRDEAAVDEQLSVERGDSDTAHKHDGARYAYDRVLALLDGGK